MGIGASAGGLEALDELLENMPADSGLGFVIVTHQQPGRPSLLPELLARETRMRVVEAADGAKVEPNHVYVAPPGKRLAILNGRLHRMEVGNTEAPRLPIDYFFHSLALDQGERAICIVLSGTGTDGTIGLRAIKGESGMTMVQQPQSAKYAGMPSSAIATGLADYVLPPDQMPSQVIAYVKGPYLTGAPKATDSRAVGNDPMQRIFVLLRNGAGHDFSGYKASTIHRRIERRMNVHQIKNPDQYVHYLEETPREIDLLFKELLITVTNFFRDAHAWDALASHLDPLIESRPENSALRAWVPGCATGEEAFSLAITLRERMDTLDRHSEVQIFGTDLDAEAIETARGGRYPDGIAVDVSPERLQRYFVRDDATYRVNKDVRDMVIFAPQDLIKDPPFTKLDLVSCRNLLIYLNSDLQKKVLPLFHYALNAGGLLFLGPSETTGPFADLFEPLDKRWKIFRRKEHVTAIHALPEIPARLATRGQVGAALSAATVSVAEPNTPGIIERALLARFAPASVVVNEGGDIIYIHGHTGTYLEPAEGAPRNNLIEMAREGLRIELAGAIRECARESTEVVRHGIRVQVNGGFADVNLTVATLREPRAVRGLLVVTFRPKAPGPPEAAKPRRVRKDDGAGGRVAQLERELQYMKESQQITLEDLQTSNEQLKSSNEELQSTNEELQSTNEELETSKEEMQSLNEELTTVNAELQSKLDELSQANDDMQNLLNSTRVATVFLDNDLNVKRFTDQARDLIMLRPTDIGRPISELASNLERRELAPDCRDVLKTLVFKQSEVRTSDGHWYLMRIMPYRTSQNAIDGLVLTFVNIDHVKEVEQAGERERAYFEGIVDTVREPLVVLDAALRVVSANRSFYRTFRTTPKQTEGELIYELGAGQWDIPRLRELLEEILPRNNRFEDFEVVAEIPKLGRRTLVLNARRLEQSIGLRDLILLSLEDMTATPQEA